MFDNFQKHVLATFRLIVESHKKQKPEKWLKLQSKNYSFIANSNWHALQMEALVFCSLQGMNLSCYISETPWDFETDSGYFNYDTKVPLIIREGLQFKADMFNHANGFPQAIISDVVVDEFVESMKAAFLESSV